MSDEMSLANLGRMLAQRRMQEIQTYNELITGAGAPVPRPDPRGQNYRDLQRRQQEIETYNQIMADPRYGR